MVETASFLLFLFVVSFTNSDGLFSMGLGDNLFE